MKSILVSIILSTLVLSGYSQIKVNPKIGINLSNFTQEDNILESSAKIGFAAGLDLRIGGRLYFAPGLYYLTSSTKIKKINELSIDEIITFNTIELPLTVGLNIINKDLLKVSLKAGIEGAYFASVSEVKDLSNTISEDDIERLNWGFQLGAGVDLKRFTFDLKFDFGKNSILKEDLNTSFNPQYNRMHLYIGYLLFNK